MKLKTKTIMKQSTHETMKAHRKCAATLPVKHLKLPTLSNSLTNCSDATSLALKRILRFSHNKTVQSPFAKHNGSRLPFQRFKDLLIHSTCSFEQRFAHYPGGGGEPRHGGKTKGGKLNDTDVLRCTSYECVMTPPP